MPTKDHDHDQAAPTDQGGRDAKAEFAQLIKASRETAGFSVEQAALATRISMPFVEALEAGAFEKLPGQVFGRGFIRNLCKAYDCDAEPCLRAYDRAVRSPDDQKVAVPLKPKEDKNADVRIKSEPRARAKSSEPSGSANFRSIGSVVAALLVVGGIGAVSYQYLASGSREAKPLERPAAVASDRPASRAAKTVTPPVTSEAPKTANVEPKPAAEPVQAKAEPKVAAVAPAAPVNTKPEAAPPVEAKTVEAPAAPAPSREQAVAGAREQVIEIVVKEPVRLKVARDGGEWVTETLEGDKRYEFDESAQLLIYDAGAVEVSFNGRPLGSLGGKGRIRRLSFQSESPLAGGSKKSF